jgi:ABC-type Fe3+ transport system permease subunit
MSVEVLLILALLVSVGLWVRSRIAAQLTPPEHARGGDRPSGRPWWGNPWVWLAASAVFLVLGLVVAPGLLGGVVIFLPFVWISRLRGDLDRSGRERGRRGS